MTVTITVAGKGGVGKTAISAILVDFLANLGAVLAVDADPSANLNDALGVDVQNTVGRTREKMKDDIKDGRLRMDVSKQEILDARIHESLVETDRFDLLAMGRPEGPGCYCAANHMIRFSIDKLAKSYDYVVMDCEAGLEHISRQTTQDIDFLLAERFREADKRGFQALSKTDVSGLFGKRIEAWGVSKSGREFPLESSMAAWQEGTTVFFSATIRDLTERHTAEEQRIEQEKLNSVLEMAGAVCHELNQPLQVIMGYAEMLQQNLPPDSPQQLRVEKIAAQAEKLGNITQKLADITRYETKSYIQKTRIVDIHKASEK